MIDYVGKQLSRQLHGAKTRVGDPIILKYQADLVIEKSHIKCRVVSDKHRIADKPQKIVNDIGKDRRVLDHFVTDPGQAGDKRRDRRLGVYKRLELSRHLSVADAIGAYLGDTARRSLGSGRLKVKHDKISRCDLAVFVTVEFKFNHVTV